MSAVTLATASTGVFGALNRSYDKIRFVQARHEEMAAFMASAYAKFSGRLGVCFATSGPGASHLITGLYDALMDHQPVLAIAGQQARNALGGQYQQELDLVSMFKDVAGASRRRRRRRRCGTSSTAHRAVANGGSFGVNYADWNLGTWETLAERGEIPTARSANEYDQNHVLHRRWWSRGNDARISAGASWRPRCRA
jgi:Thiamine pyrophosphate enzyme, N-terminal TPP binding domain